MEDNSFAKPDRSRIFEKGKRIWAKGCENLSDCFSDFISDFESEKSDSGERYILKIAADSNYTVWINGTLAAFGQYADYPDRAVFDEVDVGPFIKDGKNRMAITVWYYGIDSQTYAKGDAGLIFELSRSGEKTEIVAFSSEDTPSRLSRDYLSGRCDLISHQLGPTYHYDISSDDGFRASGSAEGFEKSYIVSAPSAGFFARPNKKLVLEPRAKSRIVMAGDFIYTENPGNPGARMQTAALTSRKLYEGPLCDFSSPFEIDKHDFCREKSFDGIYFTVDLGSEMSGFLDFDIETDSDCIMDVGFGEHLEDGRIRTAVRGAWCDIKLKKGDNRYLHTFRRFGCRYLQFFIRSDHAAVYYAGLRPTVYPLAKKDFRCGNILRETIYKVCQNTLTQCLHEHYEDCPWREQALYTMDSRNQMLCGYFAFGETEAARASLELISRGVRDDGLLMLCYPAGRDYPIPSFSCVYFIQMDEYIRYSGDSSLAAEKFDMLENLMATLLSRRDTDGIIENFYGEFNGVFPYWNFYEWSPTMSGSFGERNRRLESPLNAFVSLALSSMANICEYLGKSDRADFYRQIKRSLNGVIKDKFYNPESRLFESFDENRGKSYSVLTQSLCMLCGAADSVDKSVMLSVMEANGEADSGLTVYPNTLSMNGFRFDALLSVDRKKYAPLILDEIDREYLAMLRRGATSFWETTAGAADFGGAGSLCHGWSALPIYYYETLGKTER